MCNVITVANYAQCPCLCYVNSDSDRQRHGRLSRQFTPPHDVYLRCLTVITMFISNLSQFEKAINVHRLFCVKSISTKGPYRPQACFQIWSEFWLNRVASINRLTYYIVQISLCRRLTFIIRLEQVHWKFKFVVQSINYFAQKSIANMCHNTCKQKYR